MRRTNILLADDHAIFVAGLRRLLEPAYEVVDAVGDGRMLVRQAVHLDPDLIIADISMPLLNGIDALRQIREAGCNARILFLTMHADITYAKEAVEAGALGYVLKHAATAELLEAVEAVLDGRRYLSEPLRRDVERALIAVNTGRKKQLSVRLSNRQREVLQLVGEGYSAKEIADILCISTSTANFHKQNLRQQLGAETTAELVREAIRLRLLDAPAR